jgi:hypothetical protein
MSSLTKLNNFSFLRYKNENFIVDKFSGFTNVDFRYAMKYGCIIIDYTITFHFSGNDMKLKKTAKVPITNGKGFFAPYSEGFKFFKQNQNDFYQAFLDSKYKSKEPSDIISDYVKWFAENTKTTDKLNELKDEIRYCFDFIDENYKKDKNEKDN